MNDDIGHDDEPDAKSDEVLSVDPKGDMSGSSSLSFSSNAPLTGVGNMSAGPATVKAEGTVTPASASVRLPPIWIRRTEENAPQFDELKVAIDNLKAWVEGNNQMHPADREMVLSALLSLQGIVDHQGVWNWAGIYAGEVIEQVVKDAAYDFLKPHVDNALGKIGALFGLSSAFSN